jgi:hypothetical protein
MILQGLNRKQRCHWGHALGRILWCRCWFHRQKPLCCWVYPNQRGFGESLHKRRKAPPSVYDKPTEKLMHVWLGQNTIHSHELPMFVGFGLSPLSLILKPFSYTARKSWTSLSSFQSSPRCYEPGEILPSIAMTSNSMLISGVRGVSSRPRSSLLYSISDTKLANNVYTP